MAASMAKLTSRRFYRLVYPLRCVASFNAVNTGHNDRYCYSTQTVDNKREVYVKEKIVIPNRVCRSPTAVLEELAGVAGRDPLAPDYQYMDDPYLIPTNNIKRRDYSLAKASGRKAAQWVIQEFPDTFANEYIAAPRVDSFMPKDRVEKILKDHGDTVQGLEKLIEYEFGESAWELFNKLTSEKVEVSDDVSQKLLELLCVYNSKNKSMPNQPEEILYQRDLKLVDTSRVRKKTWKDDSPAMMLFEQLSDKNAAAYNSVIQGMCKYGAVEEARNLYNEMIDLEKEVCAPTFHALISCVPAINDENEGRWAIVCRYLKDMQSFQIPPNLQTFNTVLTTLIGMGRWKQMRSLTIAVLGEMKACGIEPSLGTWSKVLRLFYYTDSSTADIIHQVLDEVEINQFQYNDPSDFEFFSTAMVKTCVNMKDVDVAKRIDGILNTGNNVNFLGDAAKENVYYNNYLKLLCSLEMLEDTMEVYERCTPHIFTPNIGTMVELLNAIELYDGHRYLPQIWSDLVLFDYIRREDLVEPLFKLMASRKHEESIQKHCHVIAGQIRTMIEDAEEMERRNLPIFLSGAVLGDLMKMCLFSEDMDLANYFYDLCTRKSSTLTDSLSPESMTMLAEASMEHGDTQRFVNLVHKMSELSYPVSDLINKSTDKLELSDSEQQRLSMMMK